MTDYPIVLLKNLPFNLSSSSLYEIVGKYGNIVQVRVPDELVKNEDYYQPGTCLVVYMNMSSAITAAKELNGVNVHGRYVVASLYGVDSSKLVEEDYIYRKERLQL